MFKCLQTHYKMQAVFCLNISVSAAFCAAPKKLFNIVQDSQGYGFIPAVRQARSKQKKRSGGAFHQCFATSALSQHWSIHQNCYWARIDADKRLN